MDEKSCSQQQLSLIMRIASDFDLIRLLHKQLFLTMSYRTLPPKAKFGTIIIKKGGHVHLYDTYYFDVEVDMADTNLIHIAETGCFDKRAGYKLSSGRLSKKLLRSERFNVLCKPYMT